MPISRGGTSATGKGRKAEKEPKGRFVGKGNKPKSPAHTKRSSHHRDPTKQGKTGKRP